MKSFFTTLLSIAFFTIYAQNEFPYTLSVETESYVQLENPTIFTSPGWDDTEYFLDFPFDYEYMGQVVTTLAGDITVMQIGTGFRFIPYLADLIDVSDISEAEGDSSYIGYEVLGNSGQQVLVLEFYNCGFYDEVWESNTIENRVSFQIKFFEGSNNLQIHFGPNNIVNPEFIFLGLSGLPILFASEMDISNEEDPEPEFIYYLSGAGDNPEIIQISTIGDIYADDLVFINGHPSEGTVYNFIPVTTSLSEISQNSFEIFPNPSEDVIRITLESNEREKIEVYNLQGKLLLETSINPQSSTTELNIQSLPSGIYFLRIAGHAHRFIKK